MATNGLHPLEALLRERIVVLDGAMGTMIQRYKFSEADYRGKRFHDWQGKDLKGSLELLLLTKPEAIEEIHAQYLEAGADIIETNTFSATTIGLHDFLFRGEPARGRKDEEFFQRVVDDVDLRALVQEINTAAATIARHAADCVAHRTGTRRFVAGAMGPLPVTGSISPDVNDPAFRAVTFDQLRQTYFDQAKALVEAGVDLLFVETIFDTLNAKAALFAIARVFEETGKKIPLAISGKLDAYGLYTGGDAWYRLIYKGEGIHGVPPALRDLDVTILHDLIFKQLLDIDQVSYEMDIEKCLHAVKDRAFEAAFFLRPTLVEDVEKVALASLRMPPKSTYFYPKLMTGMVLNIFKYTF